MTTNLRCLLSASAGAIVTFLAVGPAAGPLGTAGTAWARQEKPPADKAATPSANVKLVDDGADATYANFARVTATPEEVIVDFALNSMPFSAEEQQVKVSRRVVVNFYTAKRLQVALERTLERHESTFGPVELDVRKRVRKE